MYTVNDSNNNSLIFITSLFKHRNTKFFVILLFFNEHQSRSRNKEKIINQIENESFKQKDKKKYRCIRHEKQDRIYNIYTKIKRKLEIETLKKSSKFMVYINI